MQEEGEKKTKPKQTNSSEIFLYSWPEKIGTDKRFLIAFINFSLYSMTLLQVILLKDTLKQATRFLRIGVNHLPL